MLYDVSWVLSPWHRLFPPSSPVGVMLLAFIVETGVDVGKQGHLKKLVMNWK